MRRLCLVWLSWYFASTGYNVLSWSQGLPLVKRCFVLRNSLEVDAKADDDGTRTSTTTFRSALDEDESVRAGSYGYSVLRQPLSRTNWDPDTDPSFDIPQKLDQGRDLPMQLDDSWWSNRKIVKTNSESTASLGRTTLPESTKSTQQVDENSKKDGLIVKPQDLDLFQRSLDTLDYPRVLASLEEECCTVPARKIIQFGSSNTSKKLGPATKKTAISGEQQELIKQAYRPLSADSAQGTKERYQAVREMEWLLKGGNGDVGLDGFTYRNRKGYKESLAGRPPPFGGSNFDLEGLTAAADEGRVLEGPDVWEISSIMDALENVLCWRDGLVKIEGLDFVELPRLANSISVNATLQQLLHDAFDKDGRLSGTTFPSVGRLRARVRSLKADIMQTLDGLLTMPSMKNKLALESGGALYSEVSGGRLVIPVDSKYASTMGIVHDTSRSGKTVYVEPTEIVGVTNDLRQAEGELRAEEARIWRYLTEQILVNRISLETSVYAVGQLDLVLARLTLGRRLSAVIPIVEEEGVICLRNAKHPILLLRKVDNVVGSDVDLGSDGNQGLVLTGPNSGGKTVILKLLGLVALMARAGIPVPADQIATNDATYTPRVDFFSPVLADIGDLQSVGGDLSTFSGHMLVCREVLEKSGRNALVLMDELGSGTDPAQGVAIAQALLEALVDRGSRVVITTHYMQLKQLAAADPRFAVGGMQFINGRPTYKLLPGTVGESYALAVAERLQLPQSVIDRATELLDSETRQMGDLIRELEDQKALADQKLLELEKQQQELRELEIKMKEEQIRLEKLQLVARREEAKKFAEKLEEKERVLEEILEKLKNDPSRRIVAKSWDDIRFVKRDALNEAENTPSVVARKQQAAAAMMEEVQADLVPVAELREKPELHEGDSVVVCKPGPLFGRQGIIVKSLSGRVEVKVNNMNVSLKLSQIALPTKNYKYTTSDDHDDQVQGKSIARAAEKALAVEQQRKSGSRPEDEDWESVRRGSGEMEANGGGLSIRTASNTVDVRGCNLEDAKAKITDKFSGSIMAGRHTVYILHGHGTGGVLKTKIRAWLQSERRLVKRYQSADAADGGDAFTQVELR